jgi:hypothetical protein
MAENSGGPLGPMDDPENDIISPEPVLPKGIKG